jgi:hypothetical protein
MNKLPPEIICYVGDFLGAEKVSLALTCKSLNQVLKADVEKIKKQVIDFKEKYYYVFYLKRKHGKKSIIVLKNTGIVYSKFFLDLPFSGKTYILKYMCKLLEVEPELIYYDNEYGPHRFTCKDAGSFLRLFIILMPDTIYDDSIKDDAEDALFELMASYKCTLEDFEKLIKELRSLCYYLNCQLLESS